MSISNMKPTRCKWRWGQEDQGEINSCDILMIVDPPTKFGNLYDVTPTEKEESSEKFKNMKG